MYQFNKEEMEHLVDIFRNQGTTRKIYKPGDVARLVIENHENWMDKIRWGDIEEAFRDKFNTPPQLIERIIEEHYDNDPFHPQLQEAMFRASNLPTKQLKDWE